jgi:hypothetical protein
MSTIIFKNNCKTLPIIVSSWMYKLTGLSEYIDVEISPNTTIELKSSTSEWIISSLFQEKTHSELWKSYHLELDSRIAKFQNIPYSSGNYTWNFMENDFDLIYNNELGHSDSIVTWSYKHE